MGQGKGIRRADRRGALAPAGNIIPGIGDEHNVTRLVECDPVGAERRRAARRQQRILLPNGCRVASALGRGCVP